MSEEMLVRHCSPTLAGMKTGNMFSCSFKDEGDKKDLIRKFNKILRKKGLRILPLRQNGERTLLYVYRPKSLKRDLCDSKTCAILYERGYCCGTPERCVAHLIRRMSVTEEFPHEIGLFLGYPPEDVTGFIENKPETCKCVGLWRVYGDEKNAQKLFAKYKKCTKVYCDCFARGFSLEKLTVAA